MRILMSEILNHHSNQDKEINIYVKEETTISIEDDMNLIINITKVSITSYSNSEGIPAMATLNPTKTLQFDENKKTAFRILQNSDFNLDKTINESHMAVAEKILIQNGDATILVFHSNFEMSNIEVKNQYSDTEGGSRFLSPIHLPDKLVNITN